MGKMYEKNIRVIKQIYGEKYLDDNILDDNKIVIEKAKHTGYTVKIVNDHIERYICSKYNPIKEAKKFVDNIKDYDQETIFVIFGWGVGYHIRQLNNIINVNNKILVIEPSLSVFNKTMQIIDYTDIFENKNIYIHLGNDEYKLKECFSNCIEDTNINNIKFLNYSRYDNIFYDNYLCTVKAYKEYIGYVAIHINTLLCFYYEWLNNLFENIHYIKKSKFLQELNNKFIDIPAIIVSAGPSLDNNIRQLKKIKGKALIIAGGRTLRPLISNGITPDFVISIDPGEGAYRVIEQNIDSTVPLITSTAAKSDIIREYKGKKIFIRDNQVADLVNEIINYDIDGVAQGGSVAHTSLSVAEYMGCNPIVLIGQDLAYTGNKIHSDSSSIKKINKLDKVKNDKDLIEIEDIYGNKVFTRPVWLSFLRWFEVYIKEITDKEIIDATEGGAKIDGTKIMALKEVIDEYCTDNKNIKSIINDILKDDNRKTSDKEIRNNIIKIKRRLLKIKEVSHKGKNFSRRMLKYYKNDDKRININHVLNKLDEIDKQIIKYKDVNSAMSVIMTPILIKVNYKKKYNDQLNESDKDKGIRLANKTLDLYEGIENSIDDVIELIDKCIKGFKKGEW